jgi:glycosyltransferase involved in cell wall biosynthesis
MKKEIISKKIHSNCIAVIPNSSDILEFKYNYIKAKNFREERPWIGKKPLLVYAGTFGKVNNLSYAIRLAKALQDRNSDICILLIGDGSEREYLIREAKNKGVFENNLFFENKMTKKKITACFSAATMCANLFIDVEEMWAGSANKFFDTLAAGKPVFLNHGGWMHDLVFTHKCGLGMNGTPIDQVANHLDNVMHDVSWLRIAGQNALKLAKYFFDRDVLAEQLEKVLIATKEGNSKIVEKIAPGEYK